MNKKLLLLFFIINGCAIAQTAQEPVPYPRAQEFESLSAPDSSGNRLTLKMPIENSERLLPTNLKLPYPIIFIHGLNSKSDKWDPTTNWMYSQYGLSYGGRIDFCLNFDGNVTTANKNFYPTTGADIALFTDPANLVVGDYYYLNFDIALDGALYPNSSYPYMVYSNQQAIAKQGAALKYAIQYVLQKTGKEKVIIMGHSMGGLAAREYLQNPSLWQPDGQHHIAKLATTGTPHGGSNASLSILNTVVNINNQSEAVRDLRESYFYSGSPGVFLYGGVESNAVMDDMLSYYFENVDVNCNTLIGESIVGLNQKSISNNLDFSCIIGTANALNGGDYVVDNENANLNYYYSNITNNIFNTSTSHTNLPTQNYENMQGLDEPNEFPIAYKIDYNIQYTGFTTIQPIGGYTYDYDDYKFVVTSNSNITVNITNITNSNTIARIVNNSYNQIGGLAQSSGATSLAFTRTLSAGTYYLEIYSTPTTTSYLYPYKFILNSTPSVGIEEVNLENQITVYPNPVKDKLTINTTFSNYNNSYYSLVNILGESLISSKRLTSDPFIIDTSELSSGIYFIQFVNDNKVAVKKFTKE